MNQGGAMESKGTESKMLGAYSNTRWSLVPQAKEGGDKVRDRVQLVEESKGRLQANLLGVFSS